MSTNQNNAPAIPVAAVAALARGEWLRALRPGDRVTICDCSPMRGWRGEIVRQGVTPDLWMVRVFHRWERTNPIRAYYARELRPVAALTESTSVTTTSTGDGTGAATSGGGGMGGETQEGDDGSA